MWSLGRVLLCPRTGPESVFSLARASFGLFYFELIGSWPLQSRRVVILGPFSSLF